MANHDNLTEIYASKKKMLNQPVRINNKKFTFSPGKHNQLQKAIIEEFAPRFAPGAEYLYVGDTIQKDMVKNIEKLSQLGFKITLHDKMPDVVLHRADKHWIIWSIFPPLRMTNMKNVRNFTFFIGKMCNFTTNS